MSAEITTTDLAEFGFRELGMAGDLLTAYSNNPGNVELADKVQVMMNRNSGNVFLTDEDCNVAMMNGETLEMFYSCPECGHEGFKEDMAHEGNAGCQRFLRDIGLDEEEEAEEE